MYYKFVYNSYSQDYSLYLANTQVDSNYILYNGSWSPTAGANNCTWITTAGTGAVVLPANCSGMFRSFKITSMPSNLDFSQVEDASSMFTLCTELEYAYMQSWNWSNKVTNMSRMFWGCQSLKEINASGWNVSHVTNFSGMFGYTGTIPTTSLQSINCSNWDTSSATDMSQMFMMCKKLDWVTGLNNFKTDNVLTFENFMYACQSLTTVSCRNWNVSKCKNFSGMFNDCNSLTELDLKYWVLNHNEKINFNSMFISCSSLETIFVGKDPDWREYASDSSLMFSGCKKLPNYNSNNVDINKAYPKEWTGGYFTFLDEWLSGTWYIKDSEGNWLQSTLYLINSEGWTADTIYMRV